MSAQLKIDPTTLRDHIPFGPNPELRDGMGRGPLQRVLLKFTFGALSLVPPNIPHVDRASNSKIDRDRRLVALGAGDTEGARVGRAGEGREGRVDTGEQLITVRRTPVHAATLRRGLANSGFRLVDLHWFKKEASNDPRGQKEPSYVVVAAFSPDESPLQMSGDVQQSLRALANETWDNCYGWDNPNGIATINFVFRKPGVKPKMALVVRDGTLRAMPVNGTLPEEQE